MEREQLAPLQEARLAPLPGLSTKPIPKPEGRAGDSASAQSGPAATGRQGQQQDGGKGAEGAAQKVCSHCGSTSTSWWACHPTTSKTLCNACREYMRRNGGEERPVGVRCLTCSSSSPGPYRNAGWRPHPMTGQRWVCSPCYRAGRRCLECDAASPGSSSSSCWCRHPITRAEWLCSRCYARARQSMKRGQQQQQADEAGGEGPTLQLSPPQLVAKRRCQQKSPLLSDTHEDEGSSGNDAPSTSQRQRQEQRGRGLWQRQVAQAVESGVEGVNQQEEEKAPQREQQQQPSRPSTHTLAACRQGGQQVCSTSVQPATPPALATAATAAEAGAGAEGGPTHPAAHDFRPASLSNPQQAEPAVQQVQQAMPAQAQQAAQQDLCGLLLQVAPSAEAGAAGLTPELAASFIMLMHTLPPGERAEKVGAVQYASWQSCAAWQGLGRAGMRRLQAARDNKQLPRLLSYHMHHMRPLIACRRPCCARCWRTACTWLRLKQ